MHDWNERWKQRDTPWDRGQAAYPLVDFLAEERGKMLSDAKVIVPGCGSGHDVRALSTAGAEVLGIDLSEEAIKVAQSYPKSALEQYECGNFLSDNYQGFDALWEYTFFCAINPKERDRYAVSVARAIIPGGYLIGAFFLNPPVDEGPPYGAEPEEIEGWLQPWFQLQDSWVPERSLSNREGREWMAIFVRNESEVALTGNPE